MKGHHCYLERKHRAHHRRRLGCGGDYFDCLCGDDYVRIDGRGFIKNIDKDKTLFDFGSDIDLVKSKRESHRRNTSGNTVDLIK